MVIDIETARLLQPVGGVLRFSLPTTISPRYGTPKGTDMQPHQVPVVDAQIEQRLTVDIDLAPELCVGRVHSPTHPIVVTAHESGHRVRLAQQAYLDRDLVLQMDGLGPMALALAAADPHHPGSSVVLAGLSVPPASEAARPLCLRVLVDCSASMEGDSIAQARDALDWLLGQLQAQDQISLSRFGSSLSPTVPQLHTCTAGTLKALRREVRLIEADMGGTHLEWAMDSLINHVQAQGQPPATGAIAPRPGDDALQAIVLITDGEVWDIDDLLVRLRSAGVPVYAVGVGSAPAESLLRELAEISGGVCEVLTPGENMQAAISRLLDTLRSAQTLRPAVHVNAELLDITPVGMHVQPEQLLLRWVRVQGHAGSVPPLQLAMGLDPNSPPQPLTLQWREDLPLARMAAAWRLRDVVEAQAREDLALRYQLVSSQTHLILVHERQTADQTEGLPELVKVPSMLAAGWGGHGSVMNAAWVSRMDSVDSQIIAACAYEPTEVSRLVEPQDIWHSARMDAADADVSPLIELDEPDNFTPSRPETEADPAPWSLRAPVGPSLADCLNAAHPASQAVRDLLATFNRVAPSYQQFRGALSHCLADHWLPAMAPLLNQAILQAVSPAPIWALFMAWAAAHLAYPLRPEAERLLADMLAQIDPVVRDAVQARLHAASAAAASPLAPTA